MKILDLGDLHLSYVDNIIDDDFVADIREDERLSELLRTRFGTDAEKMVIGGDLVEAYQAIWFGRKRFIEKLKRRYPKTIRIIETDPDIIVLEGNHDDGALDYLDWVDKKPLPSVELDGFMFEHGHQADEFFHSKLRCRMSKVLVKIIYAFEIWVGKITKFKFTKFWMNYQRRKRMDGEALEKYALKGLSERPDLKAWVLHHTHIPDDVVEHFDKRMLPLPENPNKHYVDSRVGIYHNSGSYIWGDVFYIDTEKVTFKNLRGTY